MEETDYDDEDIRLPEEATGRPMPPELLDMFGNKSARHLDLEVCMVSLLDDIILSLQPPCFIINILFFIAGLDQLGGPEYLKPITVNPEGVLWAFAHDGECSEEVN
ncbi:unnamed protein product [Arctia plantaginis]|uniref:Uncharacterized protein n=1 Tax=Arctia plantaginis TaxID=874455 RepID=A0A8S1B4X9_ARCPL|nr:unnamed protein product [Arctia plantaginis]